MYGVSLLDNLVTINNIENAIIFTGYEIIFRNTNLNRGNNIKSTLNSERVQQTPIAILSLESIKI